jgi:predicted nucleic acid-binding protein
VAKILTLNRCVVDTGVLYALADRSDSWHDRAVNYLKSYTGKLVVPVTVIPEATYLINRYLGQQAEAAFLASINSDELSLEQVTRADMVRCSELLAQYADANIGFVDASVVAVAERLKIPRILTTDRRHFSLIRPKHFPALELLP